MYDQTDPRASLAASASQPSATSFAGAEYGRFYETPPAEDDDNGRSWYIRGQNFVLHYMEALAGATLIRGDQPDEYALILPDADCAAEISTPSGTATMEGGSLSFIPPGRSDVRVLRPGRLIRLVTVRSADLADKCSNAASYRDPHPNIPPFEPWSAPRGGYRIRTYPLTVPPVPGRFGSIYRCSTFMINMLEPYIGPRDATRMSPHFHDDFEQCSLALDGDFMHYIRWPWTPDMNAWRDDDKAFCGSPSVVVIPPPAIHTTRAVGKGVNQLVDIFCPPRVDFSEKQGWVLNADDYPMPGEE